MHEYAGKITNDKDLILQAENTLSKVRRAGGNPIGLAAGVFYNTAKNNKTKITKEIIGDTFRISPRTVYTNEVRVRKLLAITITPIAATELSRVIC